MARMIATLKRLSVSSWLALSACALLCLLLVQTARCAGAKATGRQLMALSAEVPPPPERGEVKPSDDYTAVKDKGCFGKKPVRNPQLFGVIGDAALIGTSSGNAQLHKVGEMCEGFKVVEIGLDFAVVEREEKKQTLSLFPKLSGASVEGGQKTEARPPRPAPPHGSPRSENDHGEDRPPDDADGVEEGKEPAVPDGEDREAEVPRVEMRVRRDAALERVRIIRRSSP